MNKTISFRNAFALGTLTLLAFASSLASADTPALSFTNPGVVATPGGTPATAGWTFTSNQSVTVSELGYWDSTPNDPLTFDHPVALWDASGNLLTSTTVLMNSPLTGDFRYAPTTPITLTAGQTYVIGAEVIGGGDPIAFNATAATISQITFGTCTVSGAGTGLAFPTFSGVFGNDGNFGPNFKIVTTDVPEPGSMALLVGVGVSGTGLLLRRRRVSNPGRSLSPYNK